MDRPAVIWTHGPDRATCVLLCNKLGKNKKTQNIPNYSTYSRYTGVKCHIRLWFPILCKFLLGPRRFSPAFWHLHLQDDVLTNGNLPIVSVALSGCVYKMENYVKPHKQKKHIENNLHIPDIYRLCFYKKTSVCDQLCKQMPNKANNIEHFRILRVFHMYTGYAWLCPFKMQNNVKHDKRIQRTYNISGYSTYSRYIQVSPLCFYVYNKCNMVHFWIFWNF